jgi:hypothetical protein
MLGLLLVGPTVERLVGLRAFIGFYIACALAGSAAGLVAHPYAVSVGASGAILGIYGLLLGAMIVRRRTGARESAPSPPLPRSRVGLHPNACVVLIAGTMAEWWVPALDTAAHVGGAAAGILFGWMLRRRIEWATPSGRQMIMALGIALVCCAGAAAAVRPAMSKHRAMVRVFETESHISARYAGALKDEADPHAIAALIESDFLPALAANRELLTATRVARRHEPVLADLRRYVALRERAWQLRAAAARSTLADAARDAMELQREADSLMGRLIRTRLD